MTLYRKRGSVVDATQMPTVFTAEGRHGRKRGLPGDWLCKTETGDEFVLDTPTMLLEYEPVSVPAPPQPGAGDRLIFILSRCPKEWVPEKVHEEDALFSYGVSMWWCGAEPVEFEEELIRLKDAVDEKLREVRRGWRPGGRL